MASNRAMHATLPCWSLLLLAACATGPGNDRDLAQVSFSACRDEMVRNVDMMAHSSDGRPPSFEVFQQVGNIKEALESHYRGQQEKVNNNLRRQRPLAFGVVGLSQADIASAEDKIAEGVRTSNTFWTQAWRVRLTYTRCAIATLERAREMLAIWYPDSVYSDMRRSPSRPTVARSESSPPAACYSTCQQNMTECRSRGLRADTCLGLYNSCRSLCAVDSGNNSTSFEATPTFTPTPKQRAPSPTPSQAARPVPNDRHYHPFNTCYRTEPQIVPPNCATCERVRVCNICSEPLELNARQFRDGRWSSIMATVQPGQCRGAHYWPGATAHQLHLCRRNDGLDWDRGMCRP